ncbi:MAG: CHAT domain-containing protein [Cyanobacteriota bacterium]|jgi:CHAT domain-containing protein
MARQRRAQRRFLALALGLLLSLPLAHPTLIFPSAPANAADGSALDQRARKAFQTNNLALARDLWQQAAEAFQASGDRVHQAMALSNLALTLHHLGQSGADWKAIEASLQLLREPSTPSTPDSLRTLAQATHTRARLLLNQGHTLEALRGWRQAAALYRQAGDLAAADASLVNQAEALQRLGHLRDARQLLEPLVASLQPQPPSPLRAAALLSLAHTLHRQGDPQSAIVSQNDSLASAIAIASPEAISAAHLALANSHRALGQTANALGHYRQARLTAATPLSSLQAGSGELSLLLDTLQFNAAARLWPLLLTSAFNVPASRAHLDANLHLADSLLRLLQAGPALPANDRPTAATILSLLSRCQVQAITLGDRRSQSIAAGELGRLAETTGARTDAARHTQQALQIALTLEAPELSFRWYWQQGRIARASGDQTLARQSYERAIAAQRLLRQDLAIAIPSLQLSFRNSVEPLYRQYIDLLTSVPPDAKALQRSREVLEALQIAEINDFFQQACLQAGSRAIDQMDPQAALIYPILLPDRLQVIVRLPGADGKLLSHTQPLAGGELQRTVAELERLLKTDPIEHQRFDSNALLPVTQRLYDWILRPVAADLAATGVRNLVFVPDAALRGLPMAVLHDGERFLAQRYGIALAPGPQLRAAQAPSRAHPRVLLAGISEERDSFPALPNVDTELQDLRARMPGTLLLNQQFTRGGLQRALASGDYSVVHLATHGQFSSNAADTFLLAWDQRIPVTELDALLRPSRQTGGDSLDLLVLSACETAAEDPGANLGLAAIAVRSGANSTLASLWPVNDEATARFMAAFYQAWQGGRISKVDALRQAQRQLSDSPTFQHPYYWAAFTLLGNWL